MSKSDPATPPPLPLWMHLFGWYGTLAILGAYLAISRRWIDQGWIFQALNVSGGLGVALISWKRRAWQPLTLNLAWSLIGLTALVSLVTG